MKEAHSLSFFIQISVNYAPRKTEKQASAIAHAQAILAMAGRRCVNSALRFGTTHLSTAVPSVESMSGSGARCGLLWSGQTSTGKKCCKAVHPIQSATPAAAERMRWDSGTVRSDAFIEDVLSIRAVRELRLSRHQEAPTWGRFFSCISPITTSSKGYSMSGSVSSHNPSPWKQQLKHRHSQSEARRVTAFKEALEHGPDFFSFLPAGPSPDKETAAGENLPIGSENEMKWDGESTPSPSATIEMGDTRGVYVESYGCQMNSSDTEVVLGILSAAGFRVSREERPEDARVVLINTCAIRDGAEEKIWHRLRFLRHIKRRWGRSDEHGVVYHQSLGTALPPPMVVVLGCMAERLKERLLEERNMVDVVCGPDAYRDLPRLLERVRMS